MYPDVLSTMFPAAQVLLPNLNALAAKAGFAFFNQCLLHAAVFGGLADWTKQPLGESHLHKVFPHDHCCSKARRIVRIPPGPGFWFQLLILSQTMGGQGIADELSHLCSSGSWDIGRGHGGDSDPMSNHGVAGCQQHH